MDIANTLESFIPKEQNEIRDMYAALLKKFKVMNRTFPFVYTNDFAVYAVDNN